MEDYIGKYVKQFESGNLGSLAFGNCGNDWGLSCGTYQLTLRWGNCINFLKLYFPIEAKNLYYKAKDKASHDWPGAAYCSSPEEVKAIWTNCYQRIGAEKFLEYEVNYMKRTYYEPVKAQIQQYIDLNNTSRAFQECFWSWAIHRGPVGAVNEFKDAIALINTANISHERLFDIIYDKRYSLVRHDRYKKGAPQSEREILRPLLNQLGINVQVITSPSILITATTNNNSIGKEQSSMLKMKYSEKNPPLQCMMTNSTCYKQTYETTHVGVLWHSTGANNPWLKRYVQPSKDAPDYDYWMEKLGDNAYNNSWNEITHYAGLNAWIGKLADGTVATVQTMPWNYRPWGCGSGPNGSCNDGWIQFEICEDALNDPEYFAQVYEEAVQLTAYLCKTQGINPKGQVMVKDGTLVPTILCHADSYKYGVGSNHGDVNHWFPKFGKSMETVRQDVEALLAADKNAIEPMPLPQPDPVIPNIPEIEIPAPVVPDPVVPEPVVPGILTQEQFNQYMENYITQLATLAPAEWSKEAREWCEANGLIKGDQYGNFMARKFITREEFATVLYRYHQKFGK